MYMYLIICEDGEMLKADSISSSDKQACDDGILDIVCVSGENPRRYHNGEFHEIDSVPEFGYAS